MHIWEDGNVLGATIFTLVVIFCYLCLRNK